MNQLYERDRNHKPNPASVAYLFRLNGHRLWDGACSVSVELQDGNTQVELRIILNYGAVSWVDLLLKGLNVWDVRSTFCARLTHSLRLGNDVSDARRSQYAEHHLGPAPADAALTLRRTKVSTEAAFRGVSSQNTLKWHRHVHSCDAQANKRSACDAFVRADGARAVTQLLLCDWLQLSSIISLCAQ